MERDKAGPNQTTDIVIRLRRGISLTTDQYSPYPLCDEGAAEIVRLRGLLREWVDLDGDTSDILDLITRTRDAINDQ